LEDRAKASGGLEKSNAPEDKGPERKFGDK
jgi:hypothetical protein